MAEPILDKASYSLIRTNPKLTGNVKLVTNGESLFLESFSANSELSTSKFKAFKIDGTSTYDRDVFDFFKKGKFPSELAYEVFQEFSDSSVLSSYGNQYEMFYSYGTRAISSDSYKEDLGLLAPIWLNQQIPKYFVVFKVDDPASINSSRLDNLGGLESDAQTSANFSKFVLENCTAIKTFDLSEASKLGSYIRRYRNQESFPKSPITVSWRKDEPITWNGISYKNGGFTSAGNFSYDSLVTKDATIIQNEYFFTKGFQRNNVLLANILNLEFLFSDESSEDYSINRYFGLYLDEVEEGHFKLSGENFYKRSEPLQIPKIRSINEVSEFLDSSLKITNPNGVVLYTEDSLVETKTGMPTPSRVNEVQSIFYVKDKKNKFHTIKKGSHWKNNEIRLFDTKIDASLFAGFNKPSTFAEAKIIKRLGKPTAFIKILDEILDGVTISFYNGEVNESDLNENLIWTICANSDITNGPGSHFQRFFNPTGTPAEIAKAIIGAIKNGIDKNLQFFVPTINESTVYLQSKFAGTNSKQLKFRINWSEFPEIKDLIETYPITNEDMEYAPFVGGTNKENSLLIVENGVQERFTKGSYVKTKAGYTLISDWVPYLEEPIILGNGNQVGYKNVNDFAIISVEDNQIEISKSGQISLFTPFLPKFGRFSVYPIKDLDFDFYSEQYSQLGELDKEIQYYTKDSLATIGDWPDVKDFYDEEGFFKLIGILGESNIGTPNDINVVSEYKRLEENFLKEQAISSRLIPYINKWSWADGGTDVRNKPYRLNVNLSFGINNFAPSKWDSIRSPMGFSHEWYYLSEFPEYFDKDSIEESWSYFQNVPIDNIEKDSSLQIEFQPGTFQRTDKNMFDEYFIADRFVVNNEVYQTDKQLRFGRFFGGNSNNFAESFLRGVRIIAKNKASGEEFPNFNAKSLSYIKDASFNDYKFSVMLVPNAEGKPNNQIKVIKNEKWKTVVMLIFVSFKNDCLSSTNKSIDRTSLYSIKSNIETTTGCSPNISGNSILFENSQMQGAISLSSSGWSGQLEQYVIQGIPDINGIGTSFFTDITVGESGQFNSILFEINGDEYRISGITRILSNNRLLAKEITKNGNPFNLPSPSPSTFAMQSATYLVESGGFNQYSSILDNVSFGKIFTAVNEGDPHIIYETINKDGFQVRNADGTLSQTFSIELRAQEDILKSDYVGVLPDPNKPTIFNLIDVIGFDLSLKQKPRIIPIARHAGWYSPLANDVIFFRDPYAELDLENLPTGTIDEEYKNRVFELCRYKNTQFYSGHTNFGIIKNYFYHKVNEEDTSSILELSNDNAFSSVYPLINEVAIDRKEYYIFSSNWEPGYFTKNIDKAKKESIIGTKSMKEKKAFFGSKYLKVPQRINLETFIQSDFIQDAIKDTALVDGTFMNKETPESVEFYLFIKKRLIEHLASFIKPVFKKYINPKFGIGDITTLDDDVNEYIKENILKLYRIDNIDFYIKSDRKNVNDKYETAALNNTDKLKEGLRINNNVSTQFLNNNQFDLKLIYNKRSGFSNSYGFSISIIKK